MTDIIKLLRRAAPDAHIVIQGLLPRGSAWVGPKEWKWPNRFTKPIEAVNQAFEVCPALALTAPWPVQKRLLVCNVLQECMHAVCNMSGKRLAASQQASLGTIARMSVIVADGRPHALEGAVEGLCFMESGL